MDPKLFLKKCTSEANMIEIVSAIGEQVRLDDSLMDKCIDKSVEYMIKNIRGLVRMPGSRREEAIIISKLNNYCIDKLTTTILMKKPMLKINSQPNYQTNSSKQGNKGRIQRDLDVYGQRDVRISERPSPMGRKNTYAEDEDPSYYRQQNKLRQYEEKQRPQRPQQEQEGEPEEPMGYTPDDNYSTGSYASAFGNHLITSTGNNLTQMQSPQDVNRNYSKKDQSGTFDDKLQNYMTQRDIGIYTNDRPPEIDFSMDGSGAKAAAERQRRAMENGSELVQNNNQMGFQNPMSGGMSNMSGGPMGFSNNFGNFGSFDMGGGMNGGMNGNMGSNEWRYDGR